MSAKAHVAVWAGVIVGLLLVVLIIVTGGGHAPGGRPSHYPKPTASVTR